MQILKHQIRMVQHGIAPCVLPLAHHIQVLRLKDINILGSVTTLIVSCISAAPFFPLFDETSYINKNSVVPHKKSLILNLKLSRHTVCLQNVFV